MRLLLNAGNDGGGANPAGGAPMGRALLNKIRGFGFDGVRVGVPDNHANAEAVLGELARDDKTFPVLLIAGGTMLRASGAPFGPSELVAHVRDTCIKLRDFKFFKRAPERQPAIEIGNEPDLADDRWSENPRELARVFRQCYDVVREFSADCPVLTPSVSNLNDRGIHYLEQMIHEGLPEGAALAVHRYPHDGDPYIPHPGFATRVAQASKLVELAGGRDTWITETGLSEGPHRKVAGRYHSEEHVAAAFEYECLFWSRVARVKALCWYAINDGPDREQQINRYGIRRTDGTWKPIARRVAQAKAQLEVRV